MAAKFGELTQNKTLTRGTKTKPKTLCSMCVQLKFFLMFYFGTSRVSMVRTLIFMLGLSLLRLFLVRGTSEF